MPCRTLGSSDCAWSPLLRFQICTSGQKLSASDARPYGMHGHTYTQCNWNTDVQHSHQILLPIVHIHFKSRRSPLAQSRNADESLPGQTVPIITHKVHDMSQAVRMYTWHLIYWKHTNAPGGFCSFICRMSSQVSPLLRMDNLGNFVFQKAQPIKAFMGSSVHPLGINCSWSTVDRLSRKHGLEDDGHTLIDMHILCSDLIDMLSGTLQWSKTSDRRESKCVLVPAGVCSKPSISGYTRKRTIHSLMNKYSVSQGLVGCQGFTVHQSWIMALCTRDSNLALDSRRAGAPAWKLEVAPPFLTLCARLRAEKLCLLRWERLSSVLGLKPKM